MKALNNLEAVLRGPDGKCCIQGSDADRQAVDEALSTLRAELTRPLTTLPVTTYHLDNPLEVAEVGQPFDLEEIIDKYVDDYEMYAEDDAGREGYYSPNDHEKHLLKDAIMGMLADPGWDEAWGKHITALAASRVTAPAGVTAQDQMFAALAIQEDELQDLFKKHAPGMAGNLVTRVERLLEECADSAPAVQPAPGSAIKWPKEKRVGRREDMSPDGTLIVGLDSDNDVYVKVSGDRHGGWQSACVEFCNGGGGGGQSSRTRAALINLMTAIEADNASAPHKAFPPPTTAKDEQ